MKTLYLYLFVSLSVLVMSWEHQAQVSASLLNQSLLNQTNIAEEKAIPEEAIRLRVLAHSDSPQDQLIKREVRDVIVDRMNAWAQDIDTIEGARQKLKASHSHLNQIVQETLEAKGYDKDFSIEYGQIQFPVKLYGNRLYPAGEYEGLLITIGAGQGDNWWCVLFPPLCFVDFGTGDVSENGQKASQQDQEDLGQTQDEEVEVRFFLADIFNKVVAIFA
ncbi:stage II sporulation protein R [Caldalkalibacillus salinus]|uniref:stage II sporulation protein R n=1 Tax=Caldalkalibacillus salinus TaxID=2803787 RepID=UPI001F017D56|nr:stage II sporulation protein R [Caldalkalibacillus salinus]